MYGQRRFMKLLLALELNTQVGWFDDDRQKITAHKISHSNCGMTAMMTARKDDFMRSMQRTFQWLIVEVKR